LNNRVSAYPASVAFQQPTQLRKHLKADTIGRMGTTSKADFKTKVVASMRSLQKRPEKIRAFYQDLPL